MPEFSMHTRRFCTRALAFDALGRAALQNSAAAVEPRAGRGRPCFHADPVTARSGYMCFLVCRGTTRAWYEAAPRRARRRLAGHHQHPTQTRTVKQATATLDVPT